jgi:hypothetical protein
MYALPVGLQKVFLDVLLPSLFFVYFILPSHFLAIITAHPAAVRLTAHLVFFWFLVLRLGSSLNTAFNSRSSSPSFSLRRRRRRRRTQRGFLAGLCPHMFHDSMMRIVSSHYFRVIPKRSEADKGCQKARCSNTKINRSSSTVSPSNNYYVFTLHTVKLAISYHKLNKKNVRREGPCFFASSIH